jgi:hypothetical protein
MHHPIRRELDLARLAARERRLRLVMQILSARQADNERAGARAPAGLRQSLADFGQQLRDVHRRQAELKPSREPGASASGDRTSRFAKSVVTHRARQSLPE